MADSTQEPAEAINKRIENTPAAFKCALCEKVFAADVFEQHLRVCAYGLGTGGIEPALRRRP